MKGHKIAVITSFNNNLFDKYAKHTISTYSWPFPLYVYSEDFDISRLVEMNNYETRTIKVKNIFILDPECKAFVERNLHRKVTNYIYDGVRFCYKLFAISHLILNAPEYDVVIWVDADVVWSNKKITDDFVYDRLTGTDVMVSYYGRDFMHSEGGFQVFNLKHPKIYEYMKEIRKMYTSDDVYNLKGFTDCHVSDYIRERFEKEYSIINKSLSSNYDMKQIDPMASSFMNVYFDHLKGSNKHKKHHPTWLKEKGFSPFM